VSALTRRHLLRSAGLLTAFGLSPGFLSRAHAQARAGKVLVTLFLRGGVDGLSMVPPHGDASYAGARPNLAIGAPGEKDGALPLDGTFGLHPSLSGLTALYEAKQLAIIHAVGQQKPSRSHFDAQDFFEAGVPGERRPDGWLGRTLHALPKGGAFRAVAIQNGMPRALLGADDALALPSLSEFRVRGGSDAKASFEALYAGAVDEALKGAASDAFEGMDVLAEKGLGKAAPRNSAKYPGSALGRRLADVARLIHGDVGLQVAVSEAGGFDTHLGQGNARGALANKLKDLGDGLGAFMQDLGERSRDVCVVVCTEFGRTVRENGTRGTDHGTASAMLVLGGGVRGGKVYADWPGLAPAQLFEGRDLKTTTDARAVLSEVLGAHLGVSPRDAFPEFQGKGLGLFG
jgi:uncharacterized protein (DUF1501 family)